MNNPRHAVLRATVAEWCRRFLGWRDLSDAKLDELIAQLVRAGEHFEATELLVRRRGCSRSEAHKVVAEMGARV